MLPTLNPDGYETSRVKCQDNRLGRTTANGLNLILNKDFPQQFELISTSGREPETTAAVQWIQNNPFIISGDFIVDTWKLFIHLTDMPTIIGLLIKT